MDPSRNTYPSEKGEMNWSNQSPKPHPAYDPSTWGAPPQDRAVEGTLVLVDAETGNQVGTLGEHINVADVVPGSDEPVEIDLSRTDGVVTFYVRPSRRYRERPHVKRAYTTPASDDYMLDPWQHKLPSRASTFPSSSKHYHGRSQSQNVRPFNADYLNDAQDPAFADSRIVSTAATATKLLVTSAQYVAKGLEAGARTFTEKTNPVNTPMTFQPTTHNRVRQLHNFSATTAKVTSKTVGVVTTHAQNFGAKIAGKDNADRQRSSKPGLISKGLIAFGTIADGFDYASKLILTSSSQAATTMVGHRYGAEAEEVARGLTGTVKNVGLVYVDASGVSRRAVVKSVAKGMVVGRVKGGGEVVFQGDNSSQGAMVTPTGPGAPGLLTPTLQSSNFPIAGGQFKPPPQQGQQPPEYVSGRSPPMPPHSSLPPHASLPQQQQYQPPPQYNPGTYKY